MCLFQEVSVPLLLFELVSSSVFLWLGLLLVSSFHLHGCSVFAVYPSTTQLSSGTRVPGGQEGAWVSSFPQDLSSLFLSILLDARYLINAQQVSLE